MTTASSPKLPRGLNAAQTQQLKTSIANLEAAGYTTIGGSGNLYSGQYQIGPQVLQTQGYTRPNSNINDVRAWRDDQGRPLKDGIGSRQDFLNNPAVQEKVMDENLRRNEDRLTKLGVLNDSTPPDQRAGYLAGAHLLGADDLKNKGLDGTDAFGTKARTFYNKAVADQNRASASPTVAATAATPQIETVQRPAVAAVTTGIRDTTQRSSSPINIEVTQVKTDHEKPRPKLEFNISGGSTSKEQINIELPIKNILESYTSLNYLFTFSCLSAVEANFPDESYRKNKLGKIIASSGGRLKERVSTAYTTQDNPTGEYDFFIDNVSMDSIIAPTVDAKGTNVFAITFEVFEPYSIGQFLQVCELAAFEKGHRLYAQAPYLLTIDFVGAIAEKPSVIIKEARRYIPLRIINVDMSVNASGCKYSVNATVWNEIALLDSANLLKNDLTIEGKTPAQLLQAGSRSLAFQLNTRLKEMADPKKGEVSSSFLPDEIAVIFPIFEASVKPQAEDNQGATQPAASNRKTIGAKVSLELSDEGGSLFFRKQSDATLSPLGKAGMSFDLSRGSLPEKQQEIRVWDSAGGIFSRNLITSDVTKGQFVFRKGTSIVNAITEIMLMSDYCTGILKKQPDNSGMYDWFRVETEVYLLDNDGRLTDGTNVKSKLLVYKVVPYKVHESKISITNSVHDYKKLLEQAVKRYDYIYTGRNVDIIDFDITLNNAFYMPMVSDGYGQFSGNSVLANKFARDGSNPDPAFQRTLQSNSPEPVAGAEAHGFRPSAYRNNDGSPNDTYKTLVAKHFQERILNADLSMVTANLKIVGDPYYLADSGLGNYTNTNSTNKLNITSTGSMDYQSGEVDILVNFFTPVDISKAGNMIFAKDLKNGNQLNVPFSGLYQVWSVKHSFSQGKFIQELGLLRRPNQQLLTPQVKASTSASPIIDPLAPTSTQYGAFGEPPTGITDSDKRVTPDPALSTPENN